MRNGIPVNGRMTPDKKLFNRNAGQRFAIESSYGLALVSLEIEKNLPIAGRLYLQDDKMSVDEPENVPGQFGNIGFMTTGWEKVNASIHHLLLNAIFLPKTTMEQGRRVLGDKAWSTSSEMQ